jgi:hypothetical protein
MDSAFLLTTVISIEKWACITMSKKLAWAKSSKNTKLKTSTFSVPFKKQLIFWDVCKCAAEAVFRYTAENSHHLKAQVTPKNPQFQEEKISERRKARSQVTSEKSSKNYISLFGGKPARGLPMPPPPSPRAVTAHFTRGGRQSANFMCEIYSPESLAGGGGRAGWFVKRCHSLTDYRINCKLKTKIANTILLLCYLDKICLSLTGGFWQASANLYVKGGYKREPEPVASPQSTTLHSTGNTSVKEGSRPQQHTWNSKAFPQK